jgi:hypothetical protein
MDEWMNISNTSRVPNVSRSGLGKIWRMVCVYVYISIYIYNHAEVNVVPLNGLGEEMTRFEKRQIYRH